MSAADSYLTFGRSALKKATERSRAEARSERLPRLICMA